MNKFTHKADALAYWIKDNTSMIPTIYKLNIVDIHRFLSSQFRAQVMSALEYEIVSGLMCGMSAESLDKFREYIK